MPFLKLNFRPGVNRDQTSYSGEGGWYECDKIRFFSGYPQKIGGWVKATPNSFVGVCRQMWNWITSFGDNLLALGTNVKVYIEAGGTFFDITPLRTTLVSPATNNCIATTNGLTTVAFNITNHGCETGDYVTISGVVGTGSPQAIGGIPITEINAEHIVTKETANQFTITVSTAATSTTASQGGTAIVAACQISPGNASLTYGYGWGAGQWQGAGVPANEQFGWGLGANTPVLLPQRDWWFDNFDNDLVMNIRNGEIYYWERGSIEVATTALSSPAVLLSSLTNAASVPETAMQVLVSQNDKHLIAFGCQPYAVPPVSGDFDPLLIRWANQDEPQNWAPNTTNSAGFLRVSRGSEIIRALVTRQEILVWTNSSLYSLQYLGTTEVFGIQELADNISIIGPRAVTTANNVTYWMGQDKFYVYSGQVQTLPCTLRQYVFQDINTNQTDQIVCGTNEGFTEIWWFYPSSTSNWNDRYVIFNHLENAWYYGSIVRTAWLDTALRDNPVACSTLEDETDGYLYAHESGVNDDDEAMVSYIQSSDFDLGDGEQFMLTRRLLPDFNFNESTAASPTVTMTMRPKRFSGSAYANTASDTQSVISSSATIDQYTEQVFIRARGRQMALKVASEDLGVQWQLGSLRLDVRPDGKR
jgi:hypothetical protein